MYGPTGQKRVLTNAVKVSAVLQQSHLTRNVLSYVTILIADLSTGQPDPDLWLSICEKQGKLAIYAKE